jgi:tetratricopeptide (TPR) repeat protein
MTDLSTDEMEKHARVLIANREYSLARNLYRSMAKTAAAPATALMGIAETYMLQQEWSKARKIFDQAIAFRADIRAYRESARASAKLNEHADAVDRIERALGVKDIDVEVQFELYCEGATYALDAQWMERAEQWAKDALRLKPSSDELYVLLGTVGTRTHRWSMARKAFELALVVNAQSARAWTGLGGLALREKQTELAYDAFLKAIRIDVLNPPALFYLVQCAYALKRYAEAEVHVKEYCERGPVNPNLLYSLAGLQFHQGKFETSMKTIEQVLKIRPQHSGALELKSLCERYFSKETRTWTSLSSSTVNMRP